MFLTVEKHFFSVLIALPEVRELKKSQEYVPRKIQPASRIRCLRDSLYASVFAVLSRLHPFHRFKLQD